MQIHRLFEIVYLLLDTPNITARQLAERFEVSERTIYRDVDVLSGAGIPVYAAKGKGGGIRLLPDYVLDKSLLNENEQEAILLGLKSLAATGGEDPAVTDKLARLFHKAEASWIEVDFSSWGRDPAEKEAFDILKAAILTARLVHLTYYNAAGEQSERVIEPVRLHFRGGRWYLQAYCRTRQAWRTFRLSRIGRAERLEESFPPRPDGPPPLEAAAPPAAVTALSLRFAPTAAYRVFDSFRREDIRREQDGSLSVSVWYPEDAWVYGGLLSFGGGVEVLSPPHIRRILKEKARDVLRLYAEYDT